MHARQESQNEKFINALRIATGTFELYATEHNGAYPVDVRRGVISPEMQSYFGPSFDLHSPQLRSEVSGDWDYKRFGFTAGVSVDELFATTGQLTEIERKIDDGDLNAGRFQHTIFARYTQILE